jgi:hypothetical protein
MSEPKPKKKESNEGVEVADDWDDEYPPYDVDADELINQFESNLTLAKKNGGQYKHETDVEIAEDQMANAIYEGGPRPPTARKFF